MMTGAGWIDARSSEHGSVQTKNRYHPTTGIDGESHGRQWLIFEHSIIPSNASVTLLRLYGNHAIRLHNFSTTISVATHGIRSTTLSLLAAHELRYDPHCKIYDKLSH